MSNRDEHPAQDRTRSVGDVSELETVGGGGAGGGDDPAARSFPVADWERYEYVGYLGGGGMGRVYKAFDPSLERFVALKFIRGDDPQLVERFKTEARAQANVDHERICKVYEVGEVQQRPYIAMQYVDGSPLSEAASGMTLEQKLIVMREVASGLHAAHRTGLIHRDIKPSNILVERDETGQWKPYVADFGLARQQQGSGMTMTGVPMGSPSFMSPEQARGDSEHVDRRADVYGLGATAYSILAGQPPFRGDNATQTLIKVLQEVPESMRRIDASLPADVKAIVMKCLRKAPHERYESARAFADDIDRYLDGEPVRARPTGLLYRLRMKAAKNRLAVAVGSVALVLLLGSLAWGGYIRWSASRRAELAQAFGQQVERIDALARYAHTIPLHDIRPELERIRASMRRIDRQRRELGRIADGPARYALGRGAIALADWETARRELEAAWNGGYRLPEVALALGQVLGRQYVRELREVEQMRDGSQRSARRAEIQASLRAPALEYLRLSEGVETESPELVEAMVATWEERFDDALELVAAAGAQRPWLYEALQLEGEIRMMRADALGHAGDYGQAFAWYDRAADAYRRAVRIGESDPAVHVGLCTLGRAMMQMEINGRGGDVAPHFELGLAACESALVANPDDPEAHVQQAGLLGRLAENQRVRGEDPRETLERAIGAAERAIGLREADPMAHAYLGAALRQSAQLAIHRGEDPRPWLERAVAAYRRSLELREVFNIHNDLGVAFKTLADYQAGRGEDARESYRRATEAYEASLAIQPGQVAANTNLGVVYFKLGSQGRDGDDEWLDRALGALGRAIEINPSQIVLLYQLGRVHDRKASLAMQRGDDPRPSFEAAAEAYTRAIEVNPDSPYRAHLSNALGLQYRLRGDHHAGGGGDPLPDYERAERAFRDALAANPRFHFAHANLGAMLAVRAAYVHDTGGDPGTAFTESEREIRTSVELRPDHVYGWIDLADAMRQWARRLIDLGDDPRRVIERGLAAARKALEINPRASEAEVALARLFVLELQRAGAPTIDLEETYGLASGALDRAARVGGDSARLQLTRAELELRRAEALALRGEPDAEALAAGITAASSAVEQSPTLAEAYLVRGALRSVEAERLSGAQRQEALRAASADLRRATDLNANLASLASQWNR